MESSVVQTDSLRYRAVQLARKSINLKAAVEDTATGETVRVANASMARLLADLLNAEAAGEPLPPQGQQHVPIRFQVFHQGPPDAGAGVMYVYRSWARVVAYAERDEVARHVGRLLNYVDYPMRERGFWLPPTAGRVGVERGRLPQPSTDQRASRPSRRDRSWALLIVLASLVPLVAVVVLAALALGWLIAAAFVAAWIVMMLILGWLARR